MVKKILNRIGYAASIGEVDIPTTIKYAKEMGYNALEINLNIPSFFPEEYDKEERKKIKELVNETGINLSFHAPEDIFLTHIHDEVRKAGLNYLKKCIDFAWEIGGNKITFHPGDSVCFTQVNRKVFLQDVYVERFSEVFKDSLITIRDYSKNKILPCIENVGNFSPAIRNTLEELLPQGGLYLTWDIGHSYEKKEHIDFFLNNLKYIKNSHIHDHNGKSDHQVIGTGNIDFKYYFEILKDTDASFIIEVRPKEMALLSLENLKNTILK